MTCPGLNNPFDVLGELVQKRLDVGSLSDVFSRLHARRRSGVATTDLTRPCARADRPT